MSIQQSVRIQLPCEVTIAPHHHVSISWPVAQVGFLETFRVHVSGKQGVVANDTFREQITELDAGMRKSHRHLLRLRVGVPAWEIPETHRNRSGPVYQ